MAFLKIPCHDVCLENIQERRFKHAKQHFIFVFVEFSTFFFSFSTHKRGVVRSVYQTVHLIQVDFSTEK